MCNYEMEKDLLINGVILKACDFEEEDTATRKGTRKPTTKRTRHVATVKANRRKAEIAEIRKRRKAKAEHDGEVMYFSKGNLEWEIHDSKLWKPMNNKARTSSRKTSL